MQDKGCMPDSILYSALLEALWDTGIAWAQAKAARLYRQASKQGHFRKLPDAAAGSRAELSLAQLSPGMAMLVLHCWLADLRAAAAARGPGALPAHVTVSLWRSRQRDPMVAVVKDTVAALLRSYDRLGPLTLRTLGRGCRPGAWGSPCLRSGFLGRVR
jgi:pentatricopeptide repeat domain-containing protein 1